MKALAGDDEKKTSEKAVDQVLPDQWNDQFMNSCIGMQHSKFVITSVNETDIAFANQRWHWLRKSSTHEDQRKAQLIQPNVYVQLDPLIQVL